MKLVVVLLKSGKQINDNIHVLLMIKKEIVFINVNGNGDEANLEFFSELVNETLGEKGRSSTGQQSFLL